MSSRNVAVIGLGYVGLPVAVEFSKIKKVVGFDISSARVDELKSFYDRTGEVCEADLKNDQLTLTSSANDLKDCDFFIVAVPTPIDDANKPDLGALLGASKSVGSVLKKGDIVVYESTVFPGATEECCVPVLLAESGLSRGDFKVGYSPERINPGDKEHTFTKIMKVVSGEDAETLEVVASEYGSVVKAGVYKAASIKVAEAAKVIENTQRDLNIALMNELSQIFDKMKIDTKEVLAAAGTKWNFLKFTPGLVGGHCIGVDPYYLTYQAEKFGHIPQVILAGRRINDSMGKFVAEKAIKLMAKKNINLNSATVTVFGLTFKENCPDIRNSKVFDVIKELRDYGVNLQFHDPMADPVVVERVHGIKLVELDQLKEADVAVMAVSHKLYSNWGSSDILKYLSKEGILIDIKGFYPQDMHPNMWRL